MTNYVAEVSNDTISLNILAIPEIETAKAEIVKDDELKEGDNLITINVTATDGLTKKVYKVNVYKRSKEDEILYEQEQEENRKKLEEIYDAQKVSTDITTDDKINNETNSETSNSKVKLIIILAIIGIVVIITIKQVYSN